MAYSWSTIFADIGKVIKTANTIDGFADDLDTLKTELEGQFDDDADDVDFLADLVAALNSAKASAQGNIGNVVNRLKAYLTDLLPAQIDCTYSTVDDILDDMIAKMIVESQTVDGNAVSASEEDNAANRIGTGTLEGLDATQMAVNDDIRIECVSANTAGAERWRLHSRTRGAIAGQATTGTAYPEEGQDDDAGIEFTITRKTACTVAEDGGSQLANVTIAGGVKGTNCDAEGKVYAKVLGTSVTEPTIANDGGGQLSSPVFTGPIKGTNCDASGILYLNLAGTVTTITEANDGDNQLSGYDGITGLSWAVNTDADGKIYLEIVDDGGGYYHVDLYMDGAKSLLVGHTGTYSGAGSQAITADNSSGLGGTITVDAVVGADADIAVTFPFVIVEVFSDSGRSAKVAQGVDSGPNVSLTLAEENSSGLTGTIDVAYSGDDPDIEITLPFICLELYKEVGLTNLVASYGYVYDADAAVTDAALTEENDSGLSGTFDLDYSANDTDIEITLPIDFAVGDIFLVEITVTDDGVVQSFFRDYLGKALPADVLGAETIDDSVAA